MKSKKALLLTVLLAAYMSFASPVIAKTFTETLDDFQKGIEDQSENSAEDGQKIVLPTYQDDDETGLEGVLNAISTFLDFFKLIVAPVAVLFMIVMGVRLVTAGRDNEKVAGEAKNYIRYALEGLIVIFIADSLIQNVVFGIEGEIFRGGESGAAEFGRQGGEFARGIFSLIETVIGAVAVFMLITAGMRYVAGSASEDQLQTAKREITWSLVGLFVVGIGEFVIKGIVFENQGATLGLSNARALFAQVTNFAAGLIGTFSFVFMLYAGYLYVTASDREDNVQNAKKILIAGIIGIILASSAFAITNTIVTLDATR